MEFTITLDYPPTVNHYKKAGAIIKTRHGKLYQPRYTSPEARDFAKATFFKYRVAKGVDFGDRRLCVNVDLFPPDNRKADIDNRAKPVLDALQKAGAFDDDYQIEVLTVRRREVMKGNGHIVVTITTID